MLTHVGTTGANTLTGSSTTSRPSTLACATPAGVQEGDLMYACVHLSGLNANHTVTATGWAQIFRVAGGAGQGDSVIMRRVASASEPASHTFNSGDTNCNLRISISAFRGADIASTPKTASDAHWVSGGATTDTLPSIDVIAGSMLLSSWAARWSAGSGSFSSPPSGSDDYSASGSAADQSSSVVRWYTIDTILESGLSAGATGTRTGSWSANGGTSQVVGIVIEPAASGPTIPTIGQLYPRGWKNTSAPASGQLLPRSV